MLSSMSVNQNFTKILCLTLPEKEDLDQQINARLLSLSYLTLLQDFPLLHTRRVNNPALTNQQMPRRTSLSYFVLPIKSLARYSSS